MLLKDEHVILMIDSLKEQKALERNFSKALDSIGFSNTVDGIMPCVQTVSELIGDYFKEKNWNIDVAIAFINGFSPVLETKEGSRYIISSGRSLIDYFRREYDDCKAAHPRCTVS